MIKGLVEYQQPLLLYQQLYSLRHIQEGWVLLVKRETVALLFVF